MKKHRNFKKFAATLKIRKVSEDYKKSILFQSNVFYVHKKLNGFFTLTLKSVQHMLVSKLYKYQVTSR